MKSACPCRARLSRSPSSEHWVGDRQSCRGQEDEGAGAALEEGQALVKVLGEGGGGAAVEEEAGATPAGEDQGRRYRRAGGHQSVLGGEKGQKAMTLLKRVLMHHHHWQGVGPPEPALCLGSSMTGRGMDMLCCARHVLKSEGRSSRVSWGKRHAHCIIRQETVKTVIRPSH